MQIAITNRCRGHAVQVRASARPHSRRCDAYRCSQRCGQLTRSAFTAVTETGPDAAISFSRPGPSQLSRHLSHREEKGRTSRGHTRAWLRQPANNHVRKVAHSIKEDGLMRRFSMLGMALLAVLALTAVSASGAWAKAGLELKHGGEPVATGSSTVAGLLVDECSEFSEGTLTANGGKKDTATLTHAVSYECPAGTSFAGHITSASLSTAGVMSFKAALTLTVPGPCSYSFKKFAIAFTPNGGSTIGSGTITGKGAKSNAKSCAKTFTAPDEAGLLNNLVEFATYETELT